MTGSDVDRAAFIDGLVSLACFLESHPQAPVPLTYDGTVVMYVFPDGDTDQERRAAVDSAAAALGATAAEMPGGGGHYALNLPFGPVVYRLVTIPRTVAVAS